MTGSLHNLVTLSLAIALSTGASAQCTVTINASTTTLPCGGGTVNLTAVGGGTTTAVLNEDFNSGGVGPGWSVSPAGQFNNPCDPSYDGGTYMWMGPTTAAPRTLQTATYDLTCGGDVCFWLDFSTQGGASPCEGPDIVATEGVFFEYSTDGGATWVLINYFAPNSGGAAGSITVWDQYCFPIPAGAMTTTTTFHWYQGGSSGTCCDHWGIDDVEILATNCGSVWYDWDNIPGTVGPAGDPASQTVNVTSDTTFTVCFTDGGAFNCCETVTITVAGMGAPNVVVVDETCLGDSDGSITVTPGAGGTGPYTYDITGPVSQSNGTGVFTGLPPGNYTIDVYDAGTACTASATVTINPGPNCCGMTNTEASTDETCFGGCDGTITLTAAGTTGAVSYSIDGGTTTQPSGNFTGLCAGTYNISIQDALCLYTSTITINPGTQVDMTFSTFDPTCPGSCDGSATVIPSGGASPYTYNWSGGSGGINDAFTSGLCAGNYDLVVTDNDGCMADTLSWAITDPSGISIDLITPTDEMCLGDCMGALDVTATGATEYSLDGITWQASNMFTNLCSGLYTVYAQDPSGCQAQMNATIGTQGNVTLTVSNDTTICIGGAATISATATGGVGGFTYYWNGVAGPATQTVSPGVTTSYSVYAEDANGCATAQATITVSYFGPLLVTALSDQIICDGSSASISALGGGGDGGPFTYSWDNGAGMGQSQTVSPAATTTYTVTVTDGCETPAANDAITITVEALPVPAFVVDNASGCSPVAVTFTDNTVPAGATCLWNFGDGNFSTDCGTTSYTYSAPGCYTVTLTLTSANGCMGSTTVVDMVCVYANPVADFTFGPQPTTVFSPEITFFDQSLSADPYTSTWDFAGLGSGTGSNEMFSFPDDGPGTYPVCLDVVTAYGCTDQVCHDVVIDGEFIIYVPNAFTPDGDGINDYFVPVLQGYDPLSYELFVYDRWGEQLFQSTSTAIVWDGTYKSEFVKPEVYVWKILVKEEGSGAQQEYIGHVTVVR